MIKEFKNSKIFELGGHRVMFDFDLAALYNAETRTLKQAVIRNILRFLFIVYRYVFGCSAIFYGRLVQRIFLRHISISNFSCLVQYVST